VVVEECGGYKQCWAVVCCRFPQYAQSKLCNVLFTAELQRRLQGRGIIATSVSPGFVNTTIFRWGALGYTDCTVCLCCTN
jgi:NAD(P)-dependent dehydrogenase (short-subunit alcohol dehydrogenase family)